MKPRIHELIKKNAPGMGAWIDINGDREKVPVIEVVGSVSPQVEQLLGLTVPADRNIYFGPSNLAHMQTAHPADFSQYGAELRNILAHPDYVGQNPSDGSIEYVKLFLRNGDYVKVAVRLSRSDHYYARSLYVLNNSRVRNYITKGTLKKT